MVYLCSPVSKLGQDFGSVVWDDAHGVTGQVEFLQTGQRANVLDLLQLERNTHIYLLECDNKAEKQLFDENIKSRRSTDLSELVVAEVKVDQRVELGEARQLVQLVAGQAQGLDVAQTGVSSFQDPQTVIGQVHVDQIVQVLQPYDSYFSTTAGPLWHLKQQLNTV